MQIKCDKCGAVAETVKPETAKDGEIEYTFFRCPACGGVYPIATTDDALRKSIAEYERRRRLIRVKPVNNSRNVTINGLSVNVNGYNARNDNDLADTVVQRINEMLNEDDSVWGK